MKLISISGLDGSGKSTQIELLKNYLENQGKKVFYFHAIQFSIANIFLCHSERIRQQADESKNPETSHTIRNNTGSFANAQDDIKNRSVTKANFFQIILRRVSLMIDLLRFKMLHSKLRNTGYDYILSDRYFYDSAINIEYLSGYKIQDTRYKIQKPDVAIYLRTDPEIIMQRKRKPDQGIKYLQKKKEFYDQYAGIWNLKIIDGNKSKEEIFEEIIGIISN